MQTKLNPVLLIGDTGRIVQLFTPSLYSHPVTSCIHSLVMVCAYLYVENLNEDFSTLRFGGERESEMGDSQIR